MALARKFCFTECVQTVAVTFPSVFSCKILKLFYISGTHIINQIGNSVTAFIKITYRASLSAKSQSHRMSHNTNVFIESYVGKVARVPLRNTIKILLRRIKQERIEIFVDYFLEK